MKKKITVFLILPLFVAVMLVVSWKGDQVLKNKGKPLAVIPHIGQIQVLNACGRSGAAEEVCAFLRRKGFDVVESGNYDEWLFEKTIIACRNKNMDVARLVADSLHTKNILLLRKEGMLLDATVFIGKDYIRLVKTKDDHS